MRRKRGRGSEFQKIQEKKALIALGLFKRNGSYYFLGNINRVSNGQRMVDDYIKDNFYDEIIYEKDLALEIKRLNDNEILNLFDSYCKDYIVLNTEQNEQYLYLRDLFSIMNKPMEMETVE